MSTEEDNKALVRLIIEDIWNKGHLPQIDEYIADDFFYKSPFVEYRGRDEYRQMAMEFHGIFPDLHINIVDVICEGDKMAVRLEETGTMKGELKGIRPTGKRMNITTAYFYRFADGKAAEVLSFGDTLTFYQQLGIPVPNQ